jgi:hypothetical protein
LRHFGIIVGLTAAGLALARLPASWVVLAASLTALIAGPFLLARKGYRLLEIVVVVAVVLLAACLLLPAMHRTRVRTLGRRTVPVVMPDSVRRFLDGFE